MRKKLLSMMILLLVLIAASCTPKNDVAKNESTNETDIENAEEVNEETRNEPSSSEQQHAEKYYEIDVSRELTDQELEMLRYPGELAGNNYHEEKLIELIDEWPDNWEKEKYLEELILLLSEDYHEEMETLINFDSSIVVDLERPDESVDSPDVKPIHLAILIDASASMRAEEGNQTRMEAAKNAVVEFAGNIPEGATLSLRVYGHKGSGSMKERELSCVSTENIYSGEYEKGKFFNALQPVEPAGWTPIALAIEEVKQDIPEDADEAIVYIVSDGIETCDGDPVQAASELVSSDIQTVVNIIGFDVDDEGQRLLREVADSGNGEFIYVGNEQDLRNYLRKQYEEIQRKWSEWTSEGIIQTSDIKKEKLDELFSTSQSIKEKAFREQERMEFAQKYLYAKFGEDTSHPIFSLYTDINSYTYEKWRWGHEVSSDAISEVLENADVIWDYVEEGNEKFEEYQDKK